MADERRLFNAFYNLINNAITEVRRGGNVTILGEAAADQRTISLAVADTGRGHSPRRQRRARRALALCRRLGVCGDGRFGVATAVATPTQDLALGLSMRWRRLWIRKS